MQIALVGFVGVLVGAVVTIFGELLLAVYREHRRIQAALKTLEYELVMNRELIKSLRVGHSPYFKDRKSATEYIQTVSRYLADRDWFECEPTEELFDSLMRTTRGAAATLLVARQSEEEILAANRGSQVVRQYVEYLENSLELVRAERERRDIWSVLLEAS